MKVEVLRAWPRRFARVRIELPEGACVADALRAAGLEADTLRAERLEVDMETVAYAVFGVLVQPGHVLADGDRLELLRGLLADPKEARRRRAGAQRQRQNS